MKSIDLTLSVLAVLVGRHVVDGVAWRAVGWRAVGLGAGQRGEGRHGRDAGETLQALDMVHALAAAGRHASRGLQAARQRRDGIVALWLVGDTARVQQAHHLKGRQMDKGEQFTSFFNEGLISWDCCGKTGKYIIITIVLFFC